jgi:leucyl aminopeptidase
MIKLKINNLRGKSFKNYVLFSFNNFKIHKSELDFFNLKEDEFNKLAINNKTRENEFLNIDCSSKRKLILINLSKKKYLDLEKIGGKFYNYLINQRFNNLTFLDTNIVNVLNNIDYFYDYFLKGVKIKSYNFEKYKTKKINSEDIEFIISSKKKINFLNKKKTDSIVHGISLTKDLVSEPGNVLHPDEYVNRIKKLAEFGLKISILDKKKMKLMGMNALLGVGQGSIRGSYLAILEWKGAKKKERPLAFVGKGVCFDTGGISLKPAKFMEDMTYDMAGSAVVVGLMKTLALRKAKVNAVGVVGLVENMPDGNAQRPGDIVKSYSGKTIEILNTDAEGRLVLADALSYTEKKFKPKFIVDLATLTGAIIVSLGSEYAGLFSNDDKISDQLSKAGKKVDEKVWRMPLNDSYDKLIDSKKADMQNINYVGGAGSITAAQFLQRFILNKTPWAHLDIAGMAFSKYGGALNSGGATGYGVRLLNQLIEDNYE